MKFLAAERETLEAFLPGLEKFLADTPLLQLESPGNGAIRAFRESGGPGVLIPRDYSGGGATPVQAIRIQRAIGSRSPSLAVAATMHQFSVATLIELCHQRKGPEALLLEAIAQQRLLVASGFAEGRSGCGILTATMQAKRTSAGYLVQGSKKPCSLSESMDLLTASATVDAEPGQQPQLAVLLIPAKTKGIERRPFWGNAVLAGAESDEVIVRGVTVPEQLAWLADTSGELDPIHACGFLWFELLIAASYLGVASALVERVILGARGHHGDRTLLAIEVESAMAALEGAARWMMMEPTHPDMLARMLFVRYAVERAIERASALAVELLGGMAFISSGEVSYLLAASRGLAFHPPSRTSMSEPLANYAAGDALTIP